MLAVSRKVKYLQGGPLVQGSPLVPEVLEAPAGEGQTVSAASHKKKNKTNCWQ